MDLFHVGGFAMYVHADPTSDVSATEEVISDSLRREEAAPRTEEVNALPRGEESSCWCREAFQYVLHPLSGKIFSFSLSLAVALFIAATAIDGNVVVLAVSYGFFALFLLVTVVAGVLLMKRKINEGRRRRQEMMDNTTQEGGNGVSPV